MCAVEGCEGQPVAKGLCSKHYMRLRRAGDPNITRKAGPKPTELSEFISSQFREWSPRTRARYKQGFRLLASLPEEIRKETAQRAIRSNGSVNVSKMVGMAAATYVMNLPAEEEVAPDTVATPETT
jgi:hypothetical protein